MITETTLCQDGAIALREAGHRWRKTGESVMIVKSGDEDLEKEKRRFDEHNNKDTRRNERTRWVLVTLQCNASASETE